MQKIRNKCWLDTKVAAHNKAAMADAADYAALAHGFAILCASTAPLPRGMTHR
jgi:hypothetical protein